MIKTTKVTQHNLIKLIDTFRPSVVEVNKDKSSTVNMYFGANMDILIITAIDKKLSDDNLTRITKLINDR